MEKESIVIATDNCEKALFTIGRAAMNYDYIDINFVDKYAPCVEFVLRMLRKSFGWEEVDRGSNDTKNTRCRYKEGGLCIHTDITKNSDIKLRCDEGKRLNCKLYVQKYDQPIRVNTVSIEKVGAIRGME
jgi:hypothetical protein